MDTKRVEFLISMIDILGRLHDTSVSRGEPLLASVLAIAKGEAEDALRHAEELTALIALREKMTSTTSWRAPEPIMERFVDAPSEVDAHPDDIAA